MKEQAEIPQPFKGAHPKQSKPGGGGKGKQPQQKVKNPPQTQEDSYNYEDTNNYNHNENYRGQSRGHRPYRGQNTGHSFRGQDFLSSHLTCIIKTQYCRNTQKQKAILLFIQEEA